MSRAIDETGNIYGRLTVIERSCKVIRRKPLWLCHCICGGTKEVTGYKLRQGLVKSCGCLKGGAGQPRQVKRRCPPGTGGFRALLGRYKADAKRRGHSFELTREELQVFFKSPCFYCGQVPSLICKFGVEEAYVYTGIDRWDNSKGYSTANCVACCQNCNRAKSNMSGPLFLNWASRLYHHLANHPSVQTSA